MTFTWTDERCDKLRGLWADGLSASQVANTMGCGSRSAVIGKVHRLHLPPRRTLEASPRANSSAAKRHKPHKPQVARLTNHGNRFDVTIVNKPTPLPEPEIDDVLIPIEQRKQLLELEGCHCRWPVGEPGKPGFFFCGSPTADMNNDLKRARATPYCRPHAARAKGKPHRYDGAERHTSFQVFNGKHA